jgi:ABC-type transport system substrate-binding protein
MNIIRFTGRLGAGLLAMALLAACASGGAAPSAAPTQPPADAPVTAPPSDGTGVNPNPDPGIGAKPIVPKPGQAINVHPVVADTLAARVDGNKIFVTVTWTSGVEPCTILDSIVATKGDGTYTVTLNEGSSPQEIACIAIAEQHVTEFEIPDVAAGTWRIIDSGGVAPPVEVTVG